MSKIKGGRKHSYKRKGRNKKGYQSHCLSQRKAGLVNGEDGKWYPISHIKSVKQQQMYSKHYSQLDYNEVNNLNARRRRGQYSGNSRKFHG